MKNNSTKKVNAPLIRLGYACICTTLENITTSHSYSYTLFKKEQNFQKLKLTIIKNLQSLETILKFNAKNNIHFYRLSSSLIPLATHPDVNIDYIKPYLTYYNKIKTIIKDNDMRIDFHPSTYCILNSTKKEVVKSTVEILKYHYKILDILEIKEKIIVIHVGSNTFGKKNSLTRFINNFKALPTYLKNVIAIENDDKVFTIDDCLYLAEKLDIKVVLDYHHFLCNNSNPDIDLYLSKILATWKNIRPKMHFSSPKNQKNYRHHHEYISAIAFQNFLNTLKKYNTDVDIMLEAKAKDEALFKLTRELKYRTNYIFSDETSFYITDNSNKL